MTLFSKSEPTQGRFEPTNGFFVLVQYQSSRARTCRKTPACRGWKLSRACRSTRARIGRETQPARTRITALLTSP